MNRFLRVILAVLLLSGAAFADKDEKKVLAHYMPWYASEPVSGKWGWHWTMDHFDPNVIGPDGQREAAAHDRPLIGLYDSGDPDVLECQVLQMKLAGIGGVIIDWYGIEDFNDYAQVHANTLALIPYLKKAGLEFAICYEDQSIGHMVKGGKLAEEEAVAHAQEVFEWIENTWFSDEAYVKVDGRPLLIVFGPQFFDPTDWNKAVSAFTTDPRIHALPHLTESHGADGPFGWPPVDGGKTVSSDEWKKSLKQLYSRSGDGEDIVAVAFPGFHDIYEQAGLHDSYGRIDARWDATFRESFAMAMASDSDVVQIATWNDYGEGTTIEPGTDTEYRYLEIIQAKRSDHAPGDLRLPARLYGLRKKFPDKARHLDSVAENLLAGKTAEARAKLDKIESEKKVDPDSNPTDIAYKTRTNIQYREGEKLDDYQEERCRLDLYHPADAKEFATVVWFHGGGLQGGNRKIPGGLKRQGVAVAAVNYRLHPKVESPVYIEDAAAAVAWVFNNIEKHGGAVDKVFVSGHSAGGYLTSMIGLDKRYLAAHDIDANEIAGLIPFSGQTVTHSTIRKERGIGSLQPVVDEMAPLFHIRKDAPPTLLITGGREIELKGRYEENVYFWRMMQLVGHPDCELLELEGYDHGGMDEPAYPLLLEFVREKSKGR